MLTNAIARANLASYRLERELGARCLDNFTRDDAIMRAYCANEDQLFRAYRDHVDRVKLAFEANVAIVLTKESHTLRSFVTKDCSLSSLYDVERQQTTIFVSFVSFAASSLEDVASYRKNVVHALGSN